jgi:hypothetical protein
MSIEEDLRRSLAERGATVRTAPDDADLTSRVRRVTRRSQRVNRLAQVAALIVAAGSVGGVLGAFANRPTNQLRVVSSLSHPTFGPAASSKTAKPSSAPGPAAPAAAHLPQATAGGPSADLLDVPVYHALTRDGLAVDWSVSAPSSPVGVALGTGTASACLSIHIVSAVVSSNGVPLAAGAGVIGLPPLQASGLAVVSSGAFGSPGKPSGWWTIVQTGSAASRVAVEFPWGEIEEAATVNDGGVAVLAGLDPAGYSVGSDAELASVVAETANGWSINSLGFLLGGGPDIAGESTATTPGSTARCGMTPGATASLGSVAGTGTGATATFGSSVAAVPPAPLVAAGAVVQAFEQAYTVNPLFGLSANLAAVDLGADLGCPSGETLAASSSVHEDGLTLPGARVFTIDFLSSTEAVVLYQEGSARAETGTAVLANGVWKVSRATYCQDMAG